MSLIIQGSAGTNNAEINTTSSVFVKYPIDSTAPAIYSEIDPGIITKARKIIGPKTDSDARIGISQEILLDFVNFTTITQNFNAYSLNNSGFSNSFAPAQGLITNTATAITNNNQTGISSYNYYPVLGQNTQTCFETSIQFSAMAVAGNQIVFGPILSTGTATIGKATGAYFKFEDGRMSANVIFVQGSATGGQQYADFSSSVILENFNQNFMPFKFYTFNIVIAPTEINFYIDNVLHATIQKPSFYSNIVQISTLPFQFNHVVTNGTTTAALYFMSCTIKYYSVSILGNLIDNNGTQNSYRTSASYGIEPGTFVSQSYVNNTNPTAALPTNTALTANLVAALSGQCIETDTLAVNTDGILSFVLASTVNSITTYPKKIKITGVKIDSFVQTTLTGGGYNAIYTLNVNGSSSTGNLTVTDGVNAKGARRIILGQETVAANAAAGTQLGTKVIDLSKSPIFVDNITGITISKKKVGTAPSAGAIYHSIQFFYSTDY